uniref:Addiction module component n=1 Tax=Candidatus Kentrum sp. LFY TaxID=2126342 RepID=A0A450WQK7_9GAMM|nr:MAG: Putative addiction module component [Candidatus Kentron sp. LFY]
MIVQTKKVLEGALALLSSERAVLAGAILASFDSPSCQDVDAFWAREAEERIDAYERGEMRSIPAREVFDRIGKKRNHRR